MKSRLMPIVLTTVLFTNITGNCSATESKYEHILMTILRDKETETKEFREATLKLSDILVSKVVEKLPTTIKNIETPVSYFFGEELLNRIDLVSIMRSGDALLDTFMKHFPEANVSKVLIQRNEETAEPEFNYMKLSSTISSGSSVIITEPMIATGGTLLMVISLLKDKGVKEENIFIASVCVAPEGLQAIQTQFPLVTVISIAVDEKLNDKKYIVPGLGDFGDRFFGTTM